MRVKARRDQHVDDYRQRMTARVIILNGGSSSGKTSIARQLQRQLDEPWLRIGIDDFIASLPLSLQLATDGFSVSDTGTVHLGSEFTRLEEAWMTGVAATAHAGAPLIVDDVFLSGAETQQRWLKVLSASTQVIWAAVRCDPDVAQEREAARGDRDAGMAAHQAHLVHKGVKYDVEVDATRSSSEDCAAFIVRFLEGAAGFR